MTLDLPLALLVPLGLAVCFHYTLFWSRKLGQQIESAVLQLGMASAHFSMIVVSSCQMMLLTKSKTKLYVIRQTGKIHFADAYKFTVQMCPTRRANQIISDFVSLHGSYMRPPKEEDDDDDLDAPQEEL